MRRLAPALLLLGALCATPAPAAPADGESRALPFLSNDYPRALAEARARALPLFVEAWAPW